MGFDLMRVGRWASAPIALFTLGLFWWAAMHDGQDVAVAMAKIAVLAWITTALFYAEMVL